jgi:hypothetical protein
MGPTLHSILVEVLLCTVVATGLVVTCLPRGTCCRCYSAFVSTADVVFPSAEADVVAVAVAAAEALALRAHALADEGPLLLAPALPGLLFPARFATA